MYKSLVILAFLSATALAGCSGRGVSANCAGLGVVGGTAVGAATHNDLATSAIAGGVLGAIAGDQGLCR
ncbi:hypothetical protein GC209_10660 [bacterium]|nr:hypothetical protein [bacterium]